MIAFLIIFLSLSRLYKQMLKQPETRGLLIISAFTVLIGVIFYTLAEHWTLVDAIYFCVVTLGTVGYGDITPVTDAGKIFTTIYIIFGLSVIGGFFATAGKLIKPGTVIKEETTVADRIEQEIEPKTGKD